MTTQDMTLDQQTFDLLKEEYIKLKEEQVHRIGFRDNMIFIQLGLIGAISSFVFTNLGKPYSTAALLLIPWTSFVLGWTYLVNDYAVSRIGEYLREQLTSPFDKSSARIFGWETFHHSDRWRISRKRLQFCIDLLLFVIPGALSLIGFLWLVPGSNVPRPWQWIPVGFEVLLLLFLSWHFARYSDFTRSIVPPVRKPNLPE